jgi:MFS family permease
VKAGEMFLPGRRPAGFQTILANRDFRSLWFAQITSQLADKFYMFAILVLTFDISGRYTHNAFLFLAYTIPSVFLSPLAGVYADRHNKKVLMFSTNVARAALVLLIPATQLVPYFHGVTWHLLVITFLISSVGQIFAPAEAASIPFLVSREELISATSLFTTTVMMTLVAGIPIATVAVALFGTIGPYFGATVLFLLAAYFIYAIRPPLNARTLTPVPAQGIFQEVVEGIRFLQRSALARFAFLQLMLTISVVFTIFILAPGYMRTVLLRTTNDAYLILVPAALGMLVMAAVLGQYGKGWAREVVLVWSLIATGLTFIAFGSLPFVLAQLHQPAALVFFAIGFGFLGGLEFGALLIPALTVLQEATTPEVRGRIFGATFTVINGAIAVPLLVAGELADLFTVNVVLAGMGGIVLAAGLGALALHRAGHFDDVMHIRTH